MPWTVLADPEGNEFCVLEPRELYFDTGPVAAIVTDCADPDALARFWAEAAGLAGSGPTTTSPGCARPTGSGPYLEFAPRLRSARRSRTAGTPTSRRTSATTSPAEVARLRGPGPPRPMSGQGPDVPWTVLADPEGNEFCVLSPR